MKDQEQDKKDLATLTALVASGVFKGEKIKAVLGSWDAPAPSPSSSDTPDTCLKYRAAAARLGCSVGNVKRLVYSGDLIPYIHPGGQRASGVLASSIQALLASNASEKYRKPSRLSLSA